MARYYRKIIRIAAEMSPNVRLGLAERAAGVTPSGRMIVPGVLPWGDYVKRRATWDAVRQCIGLDGQFYEGAEVLLFPPDWLNRAERLAAALAPTMGYPSGNATRNGSETTSNHGWMRAKVSVATSNGNETGAKRPPIASRGVIRQAKAIGIDPAEGGDKTSMAAVDELGLIELVSRQTPDTSVVTGEALAFMFKHNVPAEQVVFDRGGGGKEHADRLRSQGYNVSTVAFGESLIQDPKRGLTRVEEKIDQREDHYAYFNRRAEMYGTLRMLLDPVREQEPLFGVSGFAIPAKYTNLRQELAPIPLTYDNEGRLKLLPKNRPSEALTGKTTRNTATLVDLIGHSPDEADALVLAVYRMTHKRMRNLAGAI